LAGFSFALLIRSESSDGGADAIVEQENKACLLRFVNYVQHYAPYPELAHLAQIN
jgi:hypothetical protein